jgi:hypothetical protein
VADDDCTKLIDFLQAAGADEELQQAFYGADYQLDNPGRYPDFWDNPRIRALLEKYGWANLRDAHKELLRKPRNLPKLQEAIEAEANGEEWPYDVGAHQHPHVSIGPCWVLVRV